MKSKLEPVTTTWENHFSSCIKCWEYNPRKTWPVPLNIKNELKTAVENKIKLACGNRLNDYWKVTNVNTKVLGNPGCTTNANINYNNLICSDGGMQNAAEQLVNASITVSCPPGSFCDGEKGGVYGLKDCDLITANNNTLTYQFEDCLPSVGNGSKDFEIKVTLAKCTSQDINQNIGTLPPVPSEGVLIGYNPPDWCIAGYRGKESICGHRCDALAVQKNLKSTYDRFKTPAPCRDQRSTTPYLQKQICNARPQTIGSGPKQSVTATYEVTYSVESISGPCQGITASETRTFTRTFDSYSTIRIHGYGFINYHRVRHCCRGNLSVNCNTGRS
jgi:hypothetical protein